MSTCATCGSPVRWARTAASGKRIPLDPRPRPDGNLALQGSPQRAVVVPTDSPIQPRYVTHFTTCPHADSHRKAH